MILTGIDSESTDDSHGPHDASTTTTTTPEEDEAG